jgi:hypothetical protein
VSERREETTEGREEEMRTEKAASVLELRLGNASSHRCRRRDTAGDRLEEVVSVVGSRPFLVSEDVATDVGFARLDEVDVRLHAIGGEGLGEELRDVGIRVETGELREGKEGKSQFRRRDKAE